MQLLLMAHHCSQALLRREEVDAVFLDCSKAFDKLPHSTIVASLSSHGVEGGLKDLLSDYLRGRSQRVVIDGHFSTERAAPSGVPHDLAKKLWCFVMQYADDIVLWRAIENNEDCTALQQDLDRLEEWCKETGLEINPGKSQHLRISN
ncbi:hypothetical protein RvY_02683 [Ramazzottius varieornatus]|uniref:Reverse transcriptase domain-containing protein n=1 Tax=Ramazzottius varieornatus TaxID=947166 RepID=A0A1D1UPB8_RAMVA|nr:hypothetical protein RvY_02683 [Ramazzottius varieornatus]